MSQPHPKPHSRDLRKGRFSEAERLYHIRASTHGRRPLFHDLLLGREVVGALRFQHEQGRLQSLAFVVMPDHFHWLIRLTGAVSLDAVMHAVKGFSAHRINKHLRRNGPVWQAGYFDRALRADDDVRSIARYIVANPLRAGLCSRPGDYALWDAIWV